MSDGKARGPAGEPSVGDEGALLAEMHGVDIGGGIEHFLHSRTAFWAFVADYHYIPCLDIAPKNSVACRFLGIIHLCGAGEFVDTWVYSGSFDY